VPFFVALTNECHRFVSLDIHKNWTRLIGRQISIVKINFSSQQTLHGIFCSLLSFILEAQKGRKLITAFDKMHVKSYQWINFSR